MDSAPWRPTALAASAWRLLREHRNWALSIVGCSVGLSLLAPLIQIAARLEDSPNVEMLVRFVALMPLELYLIPRFLLALDAETLNHAANPFATWREAFEQRWMRAFVAKMLLALAAGIGLTLFVIPGLAVLLVFGWTPMLVLLRGESLREGATSSARLMTKAWPKVVHAMLYIGAAYLAFFFLLSMALGHFVPNPTVAIRLSHPAYWLAYAVGAVMELLLNLVFLRLFQAVEPLVQPQDHLPK